MNTNCGLNEGTPHAHVNRCYIAGAVEALRAMADELESSVEWCIREWCETCGTKINAAKLLRERADRIAGGVS